jgi:hypothetical protein
LPIPFVRVAATMSVSEGDVMVKNGVETERRRFVA